MVFGSAARVDETPALPGPSAAAARALSRALQAGTDAALRDALHLDVVAFCRGRVAPLKTVYGPDAVATFLHLLLRHVELWTVGPGRDGLLLRGIEGDRLVVTIDVRLEGERAVGLLVQTL